jgi:voltage-gated potassium channel
VNSLARYNRLTGPAMMALALIYTGIFTVQSIIFQPQEQWYILLNRISLAIWAVFAIDLVMLFVLDPNKRTFARRNILNIVTVVLPMFRSLRILRLFSGGAWVSRKGNGILTKSAVATAVAATVTVCFIGSLMILNAERGANGASIVNFGDAVWWSAETVTTVGYGDMYPVTLPGRLIAVGVMLLGISMLGVVSAGLAATLVKQSSSGADADTQQAMVTQLKDLQAAVDRLQSQLDQAATASGSSSGVQESSTADNSGSSGDTGSR